MLFKIMGLLAAGLTTVSFIPQAFKTIKTKDTSGISFIMYLMFTIGVLLWFFYGIYMKDFAIISANLITFLLASIILTYKFRNMKNHKEK